LKYYNKFLTKTYRAEIGYFAGFSEAKKLAVSAKTSCCARDLAPLVLQGPRSPSRRPPLRSLGAPPRTRGVNSRRTPRRGQPWLASRLRGAQRFRSRDVYITLGTFISPDTQLRCRGRRQQRMSQPRAQPRHAPAEGLRNLPSGTGRHPRSRTRVGRDRRAANPHGKYAFCGSFRLFRFP
jgi:hypothetical protein